MHSLTVSFGVKVEEDHYMVPVDGPDGLLQTLPTELKEVLDNYFEGLNISIIEAEIND